MLLSPMTTPEQLESIKAEGFGFTIAELVWKTLTTMIRPPVGVDVSQGSWPHAMPQAREELGIDFDAQAFAAILNQMATTRGEIKNEEVAAA